VCNGENPFLGNMDGGTRGSSAATSPAAAAAFMLGNPPLAALHSMTEMKSAMLQHYTPTSVGAQNLKNNSSHSTVPPHVRCLVLLVSDIFPRISLIITITF